jgi:uncharacterized protein YoxC
MGIVSIAVMIMAVTLVVLAAAVVPAFLEIRKTAVATRETLERIEGDLKPVIRELHDVLTDLNLIVHETADKREDVATFMLALGDTGRGLRSINGVIGSVATVVSTSSLWITAAKVAGKFAVEKLLRKRGKSDVEQ